ncbi:MAG: hypothetical protein ABI572_10645 [Actinomycetota bacterium]
MEPSPDPDDAPGTGLGDPSERDRALRATMLGLALGVVLAALSRPH